MALPNLMTEAGVLGALVEQTQGVVGVVLGTARAEPRAIVGSVADGYTSAAVAASVTEELVAIGALLGLGPLGTASLTAATAARVFAREAGAVLAIELDPRCSIDELLAKLRTLAWAPRDELGEPPPGPRAPAEPSTERAAGTTLPPPFPPSVLAQATSAGTGPAFTGALEEFRLPDLLELLRNARRTGLLMCTTSAGIGMIELARGMITAAHSPNALDLRQHFLTSPKLTPERRRALAALPAASFGDDAIEEVLVSRDLIPRDEIERARVARIYSACREMVRWTAGRFSFDPGVALRTPPALALNAHSILMQLYQEQDEGAGE